MTLPSLSWPILKRSTGSRLVYTGFTLSVFITVFYKKARVVVGIDNYQNTVYMYLRFSKNENIFKKLMRN